MDKNKKLYKYVFTDGAYIYNGPSTEFSKASKKQIPVGTILSYIYSDDYYIYIEYNGIKGWVYAGDPYTKEDTTTKTSLVNYISDGKIYTLDDIEIYKDRECTEKLDAVIPKNIEVSYQYSYYFKLRHIAYYINYNGVEGWILYNSYLDFSTDLLIKNEENAFIYNSDTINIYSDIDKSSIIGTLESYEVINLIYSISFNAHNEDCELCKYNNMNYIEYEKENYGWVDLTDISYAKKVDTSYKKYELQSDISMYDKPAGQETGQLIPAGTILTDIYYSSNDYLWLYVNYNGTSGWIKDKNIDLSNDYSSLETVDSYPNAEDESSIETSNDKVIPSKQMFIYAICGAIVLALTVVVTIVLINKKKAIKNEKEN